MALTTPEHKKPSSHIFRHWAISHPDEPIQPIFHFKVLKPHRSPLDRQLHEAVRIGSHGLLNARSEFRQNKIKRVAVSLTAREQKLADKALEKEEAETLAAVQVLSTKLSCNKHTVVVASNPKDSLQPGQVSSVDFTDTISKRSFDRLSDHCLLPNKRPKIQKVCKMGRSSKGKTNNESNNLWKFWPQKPKKEVLRAKNSPTTFAEASLLAKTWYEKREHGSSFLSIQGITPLQPIPFSNHQPTPNASSCSSSGSPCNINAVTPEAHVSPTLSPMSSIDTSAEISFSKLVSSLKVDATKVDLDDSFSSCKDSAFNKGALAFISLVDIAIEKANGLEVKFDNLILQMMDLGVNDKISTASDIPDILNSNGWSMRQVSQVWSVPSVVIEQDAWDIASLKRLGGQKVLSEVWSALRASNQAGHPKRAALDTLGDTRSQFKKRKLAPGSKSIAPSPALIADDLHYNDVEQSSPVVRPNPVQDRKHAKAHRHSLIVPSRLKEWLIASDAPDALPAPDQTEGHSSVSAPTTPASSKKGGHKRKKSRKSSTPIPTQDPRTPESKTILRSNRGKKKTTIPVDSKQRTLQSFISGTSPELKPTQRLIGLTALSNGVSDGQQQAQEKECKQRSEDSKQLE